MKLENPAKTHGGPEEQMMNQQQMMMQQQMAMQQAQQQGGVPQAKKQPDVFLVANSRRNSIIVHAAPDKMAIISAFIRRIDVKNENDSMNMLQTRFKVYRLSSIDPKKLVTSLLAMDVLEPTTKLEVDEKNKSIMAYASIADHYAKVYHELKAAGRALSQVDILLAAIARHMRVTLLTTDKDFEALPDIRTENWLEGYLDSATFTFVPAVSCS